MDPSPEAYLAGSDAWARYERIDDEYQIGETVVVALREPGGTVFDVETVSAVAELDKVLAQKEGVERVLSIASATALALSGDAVDLRPLLPRDPITPGVAIQLGNDVQSHEVYKQILVDGRAETTYVFLQLNTSGLESIATVRAVTEEVDRFASSTRSVHLAGAPITKTAIASGIRHDAVLFFPAALGLLALLLWMLFDELLPSVIPLLVVGYSSAAVVGALAFVGTPLNMATAMVPTVILVFGLADGVHLLAEMRRQYERSGDRRASLLATVRALALPGAMTTATAAVGFLALVSSSIPPLAEFGYATALGLIVAHASSMLLAPALLMVTQYPQRKSRSSSLAPKLAHAIERFAGGAHRRLVLTVGITGLLLGVCVAGISRISIDSDFVRYLQEDQRLRRDLAVVERTLGGTDVVEILVSSSEPERFKTPDGLALLDELSAKLRQFDGVTRVFGLADYLAVANAVMSGRPGLPESSEAVAQLALLDPTAFEALTNDDQTEARISVQIRSLENEEVLALGQASKRAAADILEGEDLSAEVTGLPILFAQIGRNLAQDAFGCVGIAAILIFLAMLLGLQSPIVAFMAMVPNVLTVGLAFGTMALFGLSFDVHSAFVACIGVSIAVSDTLHIAERYQRAREQGAPDPGSAVQLAIFHAGVPAAQTSLILAVGFSVLCLSSFGPTFQLGLLSAILVGYAVIIDLLLLPVLLITADRIEKKYEIE